MTPSQYQVLLYNDERNTMETVAAALCAAIPSLSEPQAIDAMMAAHTNGLAPIVCVDRITASGYCQKLTELGLTSAIEPTNAQPMDSTKDVNLL